MAEEKLLRGIGRWDLTAITINTIIGAGIFGLPSKVFALIGSYSLYAFLGCTVIIAFIVLCHAEVSSRFSATGGPYLYAKEAFGSTVAFEVGWLYWIVRLTSFAANCNLFVTYIGFFDERLSGATSRIVIVSIVVAALSAVNIIGVRQSALLTNIFTAGKMIPLFIFGIIGLFFIQPGNFKFDVVPEYSSFSSAVLMLIYAFVGFEAAVVIGGEAKDPRRNMPWALLTAVFIVAVIYILVQIVSVGTLPGLAASERPLADAAAGFLGTIGASIITLAALVSILGNLNVGLLGGTRLLFAMAEQGNMPAFFAGTHRKFKTPIPAIVVTGTVIFVLTVQSTFVTALAIATITRLLVYATTCLSLPIFRRRSDVPEAKFTAPLGILAAILSIALIGWLMTAVDFRSEGIPIIAAAAIGFLIYFSRKKFARSAAS